MIERRTPIRRDTAGTRAFLRKPRKPLPKVGRKRQRERPASERFAALLEIRSRGCCEAATLVDITGQRICQQVGRHPGTDPHHLWPEDRARGMHVASRGRWLCRAAHDWAHNVASPSESAALGLLRPYELTVVVDREPTPSEAVAIAVAWYPEHPECASVRVEWPLGRCVLPPPGDAVEWWA